MLFTDLEQALYNPKTFTDFQNYKNPVIKLCNQTTKGRPLAYATHLLVPRVVTEDRLNCTVLSLAHRRENTPLMSWNNCTGCQWDVELITKSCPWHAKLWGYGAKILAETHSLIYCYTGTHSLTYSCITLHSSLQPCLWSGAKKHTKKTVWFQSIFQLCSQALKCPTKNSQGSRFAWQHSAHLKTTCSLNDCTMRLYLIMIFSIFPLSPFKLTLLLKIF